VGPLASYDAPPECPTAAAFSARVEARTRLYRTEPVALDVALHAEGGSGGTRGRLVVQHAGNVTEREIAGRDCDEVVEALALIAAITIDPTADTSPHPTAHAEAPPAAAPAPTPTPVSEAPATWHVEPGVAFVVDGALAPDPSFGERAFVSYARDSPAAPLSALGLAATFVQSGTVSTGPDQSAAFELYTLRLEACTFGLARGILRLVPCVFGEGGVLRAQGTHPAESLDQRVGWAAVGPLGSLSARVLRVLDLRADLGAVVPLTRYRFRFIDEPTVTETPSVAVTAAVGVAVAIP
jgi:hypothetical protein